VTVLLAQLRTRRQRDMHLPFGNVNQFRAQHGHEGMCAEMYRDSTLQIIHELLQITPATWFKPSREAASVSCTAAVRKERHFRTMVRPSRLKADEVSPAVSVGCADAYAALTAVGQVARSA
jgi:hypothetical protein